MGRLLDPKKSTPGGPIFLDPCFSAVFHSLLLVFASVRPRQGPHASLSLAEPLSKPIRKPNQTKPNQTKKTKQKLYFCLFVYSFLCLHPFEGVPGVDLDMPDSILTSLDLRNHQKHPKQKKNVPNIKSKLFLFLSLISL